MNGSRPGNMGRFPLLVVVIILLTPGCAQARTPVESPITAGVRSVQGNGHHAANLLLTLDVSTEEMDVESDREAAEHYGYDAGWFGQKPAFFKAEVISHDPIAKMVTFGVTLKNVLGIPVFDPRLIVYEDIDLFAIDPNAYTDYHPRDGKPINPFYAFAKSFDKRKLKPGESDTRNITIGYVSTVPLLEMPVCIDVSIGGNTEEPYVLGNIVQRGRGLYADALDWQDDADVYASPLPGSSQEILLNRIDNEITWSATLSFPETDVSRLLVSAGSADTEHRIYQRTGWDPALMPLGFGPGIYAWTFYDPDIGGYPASLTKIVNDCKNRFGSSWLIANMGQICHDGSILYSEYDFYLLNALKAKFPDFPVFLNLGALGFGPDDVDLCGTKFEDKFRNFFASLEIEIGLIAEKYDLIENAEGFSFDFEIPMAQFPLWRRAEFLDSYGDFIARLRRNPAFEGKYFCAYLDALMPMMLEYDYDALNHCKQADFFFAAAFPASYVWDQNWWLYPGNPPQYWEVPSAFDYLVDMLDVYAGAAETCSSMFHPVLDTQGGWLDYKFDTLDDIQVCDWEGVANISDWCFAHPSSFGTSDELKIAKNRWRHKKVVERVIADIPETNIDVLGKIGAVFIVLGDMDPDVVGDDIVFARAPFGLDGLREVVDGYGSAYMEDVVIFHWEVAQDWKLYGLLQSSPTGLGAVSGRVLFDDGSEFRNHKSEFYDAYIEVTGLPADLPEYFYRTDLMGLDDGSYVIGGLPAGMTVTLQAFAGSYTSEPIEVEISDGVHTRGVDLVLM